MRIVVFIVLFLAGCAAGNQKPVDISDIDIGNPAYVGYYVTYSEVCAQFNGTGADNLKLRALIEEFEGNKTFRRGYVLNRSAFGAGSITGLDNCDKAKAVINAAYDSYIFSEKQASEKFQQGSVYQLNIAWNRRFSGEANVPMTATSVGKMTSLHTDEFIWGRPCGLVIRFGDTGKRSNSWYMHCQGGPYADGNLRLAGKDALVAATGADSLGNEVSFTIRPNE